MSTQIKVIFKNETKKFRKPEDYASLHQQTVKAFGSSLPKNFKFFYQDPEGDLISISCQEDLEEAYSSMSALRLIVEGSIQEARNLLEPDFSMQSSSLNMPMQTSSQQHQVE
jgi:PB1 domain